MVNWGVEVEDDSGAAIDETPGVSDWVIRKQATPAIKDWLLQPTVSKPWTKNLRQATPEHPEDEYLPDGWKWKPASTTPGPSSY